MKNEAGKLVGILAGAVLLASSVQLSPAPAMAAPPEKPASAATKPAAAPAKSEAPEAEAVKGKGAIAGATSSGTKQDKQTVLDPSKQHPNGMTMEEAIKSGKLPAVQEEKTSEIKDVDEESVSSNKGGASAPVEVTKLESKTLLTDENKLEVLRMHEATQHFNLARKYMANWDTELAEAELRAAIMYAPDLKIAHRDYCLVAMMRGKPLRALAEFMMVVGIGEPIPLDEAQQAELNKDAARLHYNKALEHGGKDNWEQAITELMWAKKYEPLDATIEHSLAFAYASKGDIAKAQEHYESSLTLNPEDPYAHADFAFLLSDKGRLPAAIKQMTDAVKLNPDAVALHSDLGWLLETSGDHKKAVEQFERATELSPDYPGLWYHLGLNLQKSGKKAEAKTAFERALALQPDFDAAKKALNTTTP